ncbi:hypothetical protein BC628DRAFT_744611 [Trametes gibbosa]|nr:hypothetical protein BC628DRAFT_744611 [Trametes gibbosa]
MHAGLSPSATNTQRRAGAQCDYPSAHRRGCIHGKLPDQRQGGCTYTIRRRGGPATDGLLHIPAIRGDAFLLCGAPNGSVPTLCALQTQRPRRCLSLSDSDSHCLASTVQQRAAHVVARGPGRHRIKVRDYLGRYRTKTRLRRSQHTRGAGPYSVGQGTRGSRGGGGRGGEMRNTYTRHIISRCVSLLQTRHVHVHLNIILETPGRSEPRIYAVAPRSSHAHTGSRGRRDKGKQHPGRPRPPQPARPTNTYTHTSTRAL